MCVTFALFDPLRLHGTASALAAGPALDGAWMTLLGAMMVRRSLSGTAEAD
jgi:hypothetical protein